MKDPSVRTTQLHHWLERMRAGDPAASDELLRSFSARLELLARKMLHRFPQVKRWAQTDDVLQNAVLRLLRSLHKMEPASVRDFLGLAALEIRRELLDLCRHYYGTQGIGTHLQTQSRKSSRSTAVPEPLDEADDPDELERWTAFHEGVATLPEEEREVVGLIYYHGWTRAEVAHLFKVSERTIRRRWETALVRLHRVLKDQE